MFSPEERVAAIDAMILDPDMQHCIKVDLEWLDLTMYQYLDKAINEWPIEDIRAFANWAKETAE
jgi:hypothetical protein